eukprot:gene17015-22521_t
MDQDWTPVVLKKSSQQKAANSKLSTAQALTQAKIAGNVVTERRIGAAENKSSHSVNLNAKKIEEETDNFTVKTIDKNLAKAIVQARTAKKLTQAQLATAINERPQVIQQYENGQAVPNPNVINKLDKALGIHLPRK